MEARVFGTFTKNNGFIYRTNTYIQFGESEEIIGACVLCNPGSASLKDAKAQESLEEFDGHKIIRGEAKDDRTMEQLTKILRGVYEEKLQGQFLIFNLFTLRHPKMKEALSLIKSEDIDNDLLNKDYFDYIEKESSIPWTLIGWGCEDNKDFNSTRKIVIKFDMEQELVGKI